jgi:hypothetical protein
MQSFWASRAAPYYLTEIHPLLMSFVEECCGTLARLIAYVGALALIGILGLHVWDQLPAREAQAPAKADWAAASRSFPAFAVSRLDTYDKTETYEIFRHPQGGRKDIFHWAGSDEKPLAALEIYRLGAEADPSTPGIAELAGRMGTSELKAAGVIDTKFGAVSLLHAAVDGDHGHSCLGFIKQFDEPNLMISGWSCQGNALPARRAAIGCILNRLTLLASGNEPKLAELFARAELKRRSCTTSATSSMSEDWITGPENPALRSAF